MMKVTLGWTLIFLRLVLQDVSLNINVQPVFLRYQPANINCSEMHEQIQLIYAGKAHPHDEQGKKIIQNILQISKILKDHLRLVFLPNYDMGLAMLITSGVDLWLNTPKPPNEASGTSRDESCNE